MQSQSCILPFYFRNLNLYLLQKLYEHQSIITNIVWSYDLLIGTRYKVNHSTFSFICLLIDDVMPLNFTTNTKPD